MVHASQLLLADSDIRTDTSETMVLLVESESPGILPGKPRAGSAAKTKLWDYRWHQRKKIKSSCTLWLYTAAICLSAFNLP